MTDPNRTNEERQQLRDFYLERATQEGIREGLRLGRSLRCQNGYHECRNSGENCICICHDWKPVQL